MSPIVIVLAFLTTVLAAEGLYLMAQARRRANPSRVRARLRVLAGYLQAQDFDPRGPRNSLVRGFEVGRRSLGNLVLQLVPKREVLELLLYRAGTPLSAFRFLLTSMVLAVGGWLVASALTNDVRLGSMGLGAGLVPWLALRQIANRRMAAFEAQFPDALELLTRAMRAGHSLGVGFQLVGEEMGDPIAIEFAQVAEEVKFGLDIRRALANLAYRIDVPDLPYFVAAVLIQRETGGNLAELLEKLGTLIRERAKFHGKLRALTSQGRLSATVLALWPGVTVGLLVIFHPFYVQPLLETTEGHIALLASAGLVGAGYLIARQLAKVQV
jgi:tight adherence protein B